MNIRTLTLAATLILGAMSPGLASANEAFDDSPSAAGMAIDLLVVRPVSLVATVLGAGLFVVQLPLSLIQFEAPKEPAKQLVVTPFRYTFSRRLGSEDYAW